MSILRRSNRLVNNSFNYYTKPQDEINYSDICPSGTVIKLSHPTKEQAKFPFLFIMRSPDIIYSGDLFELLDNPVFFSKHINHKLLLEKGEQKFTMRGGNISLTNINHDMIFSSIERFEIYLLREKLCKDQHQIKQLKTQMKINGTQIINKHYRSLNGGLSNIYYMNSKKLVRDIPMSLPLFLIHVRYPICQKSNKIKWNITGAKGKRKYSCELGNVNEPILISYFGKDIFYRQKKLQ
eukprot:331945_1